MKNEDKKALLTLLLESVDEKLREYSFTKMEPVTPKSDLGMERWFRALEWKRDGIYIIYDKIFTDDVVISVTVDLPVSPIDTITLDGTTVSYVARKVGSSYKFPLFAVGTNRFVKKIVNDTLLALSWFENYKTPHDCLMRLESGETNMGPLKSDGATRRAFDYLRAL